MRGSRAFLSLASLLVALSAVSEARAREPAAVDDAPSDDEVDADDILGPRGNLRTRAEQVSFDPQEKTLELAGNVRMDAAPFHLRSERIRLTRTRYGVEIDGHGTLAFCPCLGTPLRVDFDHAIVAPPGDLILENPTLRFYNVPILPLPYFWLRSDEKLGLLPPDVAYRGQDGFFLGGGVHVPWKSGGEKLALDLRSGAYLFDGFVVDARLRSPVSTTKVRLDRLPGAPAPALPGTPSSTDEGLLVDARGATRDGDVSVAWDVDAIRGRRGVAATTELDAAAKPWDRGQGVIMLRPDRGRFVVSSGVRAVSRRGGGAADFDAIGPIASIRTSEAPLDFLTYDANVEGGAVRALASPDLPRDDTLSFVRAEAGMTLAANAGPIGASVAGRAATDASAAERRDGANRAAQARGRIDLPLARAVSSGGVENDPWIHLVEPYAEGAVLHASGNGLLGTPVGRGVSSIDGTAHVARGGVATALGRWGKRVALDADLSGGAAFGGREAETLPLARARLAASTPWLGLGADGASTIGDAPVRGVAAVARTRFGAVDGLRLMAGVATRAGVDPVLARLLTDVALEPPGGFLAAEATTTNATLVVPWHHAVTTSLGADADVTHEELVAARAGVELHDRCGCLTLRVNGAHRIGREGVDVWLALDFAANR